MRYTNSTPFPTLCFESAGPEGRAVHTVVVRATTAIVPGGPLRLADEQLPVNLTDRYFGKPGESSLRYPTDLAPYKPRTDIIVIGTAYPPKELSRAWTVSVTVGEHRKSLVVTGPLSWEKKLFGWALSRFRPARKQAIRYEDAFGGALRHVEPSGNARLLDVYRGNPVGKGWVSPLAAKIGRLNDSYPAARFYSAGSDIPPKFGKEYAVEGLCAIAPTWAFRQRYVGTWEDSGGDAAPIPSDFNPLFFNCAHPDLIVPYLKGDEKVQLVHLTPEGTLDFHLPGYSILVNVRHRDDKEAMTVPAVLDTLLIEPDDMRATLVWRATVPADEGLEALETQVILNEKAAAKEPGHE